MRKTSKFLIISFIIAILVITPMCNLEMNKAIELTKSDSENMVINSIAETEEEAKLAQPLSEEQKLLTKEKRIEVRERIHAQFLELEKTIIVSNYTHEIPSLQNQTVEQIEVTRSTSFPIDSDFSDDKAHFLTKEGTYFAKMSYSKIIFEVPASVSWARHYLVGRIVRINDEYSRVLKVYVNDNQKYSGTIGYSKNFDIDLGYISSGDEITIRINWGSYVDQGWLLEHVYLDRNDIGYTFEDQYFPKEYYSEIETKFIGGPNTRMDISIDQIDDETVRFLSFYVDGTQIQSEIHIGSSGYNDEGHWLGNWPFDIDWDEDDQIPRTVHTLTLRIRSGSASETGWALTNLRIYYEALYVEYDWMVNGLISYRPDDSVFESIEDYYKDFGYEGVIFVQGSMIPYENNVLAQDLDNYYITHCGIQTSFPDNHRYIVFGNKADSGALGFNRVVPSNAQYTFNPKIFIAVGEIYWEYAGGNSGDNKQRSIIMHELGHTLTIFKAEYNSDTHKYEEYYDWGNRDESVMNVLSFWGYNSESDSPYSLFYWIGDGKWWELREDMFSEDSKAKKPCSDIVVGENWCVA